MTRRRFMQGLAAFVAGGTTLAGYAFAIEPYRLTFPRYRLTPTGWPTGLSVKIAAIADLHACEPWMTLEQIRGIVQATNAQEPDVIVLLGDYVTHHRFVQSPIPHAEWAAALAELKAPLGVYAILGNHDWWESDEVQRRRAGPTPAGEALHKAGIPVLENDALRLSKGNRTFWLAGLGDQWTFFYNRKWRERWTTFGYEGVDDLDATLAKITDDAPVVMLAHEPDVFERMPDRVAITLSGHTHGGQIQFLGYAPVVPSRYGRRYVYGHISESARDLIVSGGLGCSGVPLRFGRPPEVPIIELSA